MRLTSSGIWKELANQANSEKSGFFATIIIILWARGRRASNDTASFAVVSTGNGVPINVQSNTAWFPFCEGLMIIPNFFWGLEEFLVHLAYGIYQSLTKALGYVGFVHGTTLMEYTLLSFSISFDWYYWDRRMVLIEVRDPSCSADRTRDVHFGQNQDMFTIAQI
jgi:hypothetical protein